MYKNFNLTDEERKTILEQHKQNGYKTSVNESFMDDNEMDINPDDYESESLKMPDNFESYYMLVSNDGTNINLIGGDSNETFSFSNIDWLDSNGYKKTEFDDIDNMFSEIEGIGKHFSSNPETAKITAETFKKFNGGKPFVVWMKGETNSNYKLPGFDDVMGKLNKINIR